MGHKVKIGNEIKDIKGGKVRIGGEIKDIKGGKVRIGGEIKDIKFGTPIGEFDVGQSFYAPVGGVKTELVVVNQGKPSSSDYDDSFSGSWAIARDIYTMSVVWSGAGYPYGAAAKYLTETFLPLLPAEAQALLKSANLTSSYAAKVFLPSLAEVGLSTHNEYTIQTPALLEYFRRDTAEPNANGKRIASYAGTASKWYVRDTWSDVSDNPYYVTVSGSLSSVFDFTSKGIRPLMIFDSEETLIDDDGNIIT